MKKLLVKNLGPIKNAKLELRDLTIFSGLNASGKGILLQLIKLDN
jgi:predicted ATPase